MIDIKFVIGFVAGVVVSHIYPVVASTIYTYVIKGWELLQGAIA